MKEYQISVNQFGDFTKGSEATKRRIIRQQKNPPTVMVARYALAKSRIKKAIERRGDINPILEGIEQLKKRKPETDWQINDRKVSLEAMERFVIMKLPNILKEMDEFEVLKKFEFKSFVFSGVNILVSPDIIVRGSIGGKKYIGAVKLHVSKSGAFDVEQSKYVATCIYNYLKSMVKDEDLIVLPQLCFSLDVFADTIISAPKNIDYVNVRIAEYCKEIIKLWDAA
jgi:hypothetical protein